MARERTASLLERDEAISVVDEILASACAGEGSVTVIEAPAGLGKTALIDTARERAASAGLRVAVAHGAELERDFPFGIVRQLFERAVAGAAADERQRLLAGPAALATEVLGVEHERESPGDRAAATLSQGAAATTHGLYWLVANLAERSPLMLSVDDAHVADTASLRWLGYLARRLDGLPVSVLLAARPRESTPEWQTLDGIVADRRTRTVRLAPLTRDGAVELICSALGRDPDVEFCDVCHFMSGGNPFLLRELIEAVARAGVEPTAGSVTRVRELVPETVTRAVLLRMAGLPDAAPPLAWSVAVLESQASLRDAAALAELDVPRATRAADGLARAGILEQGFPLRFVHPLLRAAVMSDIPPAERSLWHARAARVIESGGAASDRVAAHLLRAQPAGDPWVVARLRHAAAQAVTRGDARSAVALLRRAFVEPVSDEARVPLLEELLQAAFSAMDPSAFEGLDVDVAAEVGAEPDALLRCAMPVMLTLFYAGREDEGLAAVERAAAFAASNGDEGLALRLVVRWMTFAQLEPAEALRKLEPYTTAVEPGTFGARLLDASMAFFRCFSARPASEVGEQARRAFDHGRLVGELTGDDWVLGTCVFGLLLTDELGVAERVIEQVIEVARANGSASGVATGSFLRAQIAWQRGELIHAEGDAELAVRAFGEAGIVGSQPWMTALHVNTLVERGRVDDAAVAMTAVGMDGEVPPMWSFDSILWSRAKLRIAQGRTQEGVDDVLELARRRGPPVGGVVLYGSFSYIAPCMFQLGAREEARRLAEHELREARTWGTPRTIGQALRGLGLVTPGPRGLELLRDAVDTLARSPARLEHARALIDLGAALRRRNHRSEARAPLRAGLDVAYRCGAQPMAERALHELRATGAKPRTLVVSGVEALTASERRVAEMAAEGHTNRQIAQGLFVTIKTVDTHMTHVFQKLDLRSRDELRSVLADAAPKRHSELALSSG
jgi:DNA-binding CsgD family transcriptional regulator